MRHQRKVLLVFREPTIYVSYTPATSSASKAWPALDRVITSLYAEYFSEQPPTRSELISDFLIDILVEIECLVYRPL